MSNSRITSKIDPWNNRWRATLAVDGYEVIKSYHDTYEQALAWCAVERAKLAQEIRDE